MNTILSIDGRNYNKFNFPITGHLSGFYDNKSSSPGNKTNKCFLNHCLFNDARGGGNFW